MEIWKDIPNYNGHYQVSNLGNVKSLKAGKERILKNIFDGKNYLCVSLLISNKRKTKNVHQLVAITFLNHVPCGYKLVVDHINNIRTDNRVENLQLITQRENSSKDSNKFSSKYVGVCWLKKRNKWVSTITINKKVIHLGYFKNEIDAHLTYQNKLKEIINGGSDA